jgi:alkylation response protein AidB-like acyl-CoA dehydrogenase
MWITNAGFANLLTVFAKIDDDKNLSAFLVEADWEGVSLNAEEKKMGIKGSSTRQVFFNNVKVPVENLLFERDKGFKIALNILNIGRIKLGVAGVGASKETINYAVNYAQEREQFGRSISKYGAIKYKLAEQAIKTWVLESATYRASGDITNKIHELEAGGLNHYEATLKGVEEYAIECAILKVFGSEVLDYVVDEGVQIYGGMGFSAEAPMDRAYRDARINRIFEGTNEINRMLTISMLLKRAMKGEIDLMSPAMAVANELMSIPDFGDGDDSLFAAEWKYIKNFKKAGLMVAGSAVQKLMATLTKEQQILTNLSDMLIETYAAESALLRVQKLVETKGEAACELEIAMVRTFIYDTADNMNKYGKDAINSFAEGDELRMMLMGLKRFTKHEPFNPKAARLAIADKVIAENKYCF